MNTNYLNVLIADDEEIVREGLKYIIDWNELGFCICAEAENGKDALNQLSIVQPDLILIDIRMPLISGIEFIEKARENGYTGEFIILSGFSDFKYAQAALKFKVSDYLTKPINESKLISAVLTVKEKIEQKQQEESSKVQYLKKAKSSILFDLLKSQEVDDSLNYFEFDLAAPIYQVITYEGYTPFYASYNFADLLCGTNEKKDLYEHLTLNGQEILILKGFSALTRFQSCLSHYACGTEKGSPLDSIFLAYGHPVYRIHDIHSSYEECSKLMTRRFFCDENQHVLSFEDLPSEPKHRVISTVENAQTYSNLFIQSIKTYNRRKISQILTEIKELMIDCSDDILSLKHFMADIFLQIKQDIIYSYASLEIPSPPNAICIKTIENKYYLYEIFLYFTEQFEIYMNAIGGNSNESIFEDILYYIDHNFASTLKLESIAPLFGYNSSYLGKLFTQRVGKAFNSYLDEIRIKHSIDFLTNTDRKVYEIPSLVGYKNVNYFHQKFKKVTGFSPSEYRKRHTS